MSVVAVNSSVGHHRIPKKPPKKAEEKIVNDLIEEKISDCGHPSTRHLRVAHPVSNDTVNKVVKLTKKGQLSRAQERENFLTNGVKVLDKLEFPDELDRILKEHPQAVNYTDHHGKTLLENAIKFGCAIETFQVLLRYDPFDLENLGFYLNEALLTGVTFDLRPLILALINRGYLNANDFAKIIIDNPHNDYGPSRLSAHYVYYRQDQITVFKELKSTYELKLVLPGTRTTYCSIL